MSSPSLIIRRVVVEGNLSMNQQFTSGLNVVQAIPTNGDPQSTNSCGKTGLVELIKHGCGVKQISKEWHFQSIGQQVQTLWLELEANGKLLTIERSMQSLSAVLLVREGPYFRGIKNTPSDRVSVDNMSSLLLNALSIPNVSVKMDKGDLTPLSFPLLMRSFILHQNDSFGAILDKVIPEKRKTDIIGFLGGITSIRRFEIEEELSRIQLDFKNLNDYFEYVKRFLRENGVPSLGEAQIQVSEAEQHLNLAREKQIGIQRNIRENIDFNEYKRDIGRIEELRSKILSLQEEISYSEQAFTFLQRDYERLEEMLASLLSDKKKVQRIYTSNVLLSGIDFDICPRCMSSINNEMRQRELYARCSLCNRPLTVTSDKVPIATPRTEDIDFQIEEVQLILGNISREKDEKLVSIRELNLLKVDISQALNEEARVYVSPSLDILLAQTYEVATYESELARTRQLFSQAAALDEIKKRVDDIKHKQDMLEEQLKEAKKPNRERLERLRQIYESILRAVEFPGFRYCSIDTRTFMPEINGNSYSSEGAALKGLAIVCYHLALLELARKEQIYFPLTLIIDSPAVGDMNEVSYANLLHYLVSLQFEGERNEEINWQIILTTRDIVEEMEPYVKLRLSHAPNMMLLRQAD